MILINTKDKMKKEIFKFSAFAVSGAGSFRNKKNEIIYIVNYDDGSKKKYKVAEELYMDFSDSIEDLF